MTAKLLIGDVRLALDLIPDGSIDLLVTSPPFFLQRAYLPPDHPDKGLEIGQEDNPGDFIDGLLDVIELCAPKLAPHGSMVFELGDTYSGSGGAGGDYNTGGMREGQPKFEGTAAKARKPRSTASSYNGGPIRDRAAAEEAGIAPHRLRTHRLLPGYPLEKSTCCIPDLLKVALSYGFNPLTRRQTPMWIVRNDLVWAKPNPTPGDDGDKFRTATERLIIATMSKRRYWGGDLVRVPAKVKPHKDNRGGHRRENIPGQPDQMMDPVDADGFRIQSHPLGAPLLDWWQIPTQPTKQAHYATFPENLVTPLVLAMCPEKVCIACGEPSSPIVESTTTGVGFTLSRDARRAGGQEGDGSLKHGNKTILGWSDCGHNSWRRGIVLDPFAGSGTTLQVTTRLNRDAIGIDLDSRNAALVQQRVGMFLSEVIEVSGKPDTTEEVS